MYCLSYSARNILINNTIHIGYGEVVNCSLEQNSVLFNSVRAGLGQFGIILRARIKITRAQQMKARVYTLSYTSRHLVYNHHSL